jgi:hypothetical protein
MSRPPTDPLDPRDDALLLRYQEANALDGSRPSAALREAVLAHARLQATAQPTPAVAPKMAANDRQWKLRALASVAVLGLVGLLVMQFERGTPQEQEMALGVPSPRTDAPSAARQGVPAKPEAQPSADTTAGHVAEPAAVAKASTPQTAPPSIASPAPAPPSSAPTRPAPMAKAMPPVSAEAPEAATAIAPMKPTERLDAEAMARAETAPNRDAAPAMAQAEAPAPMAQAPSAAPTRSALGESRKAARRAMDTESQSGTARDFASPQLPPLHGAVAEGGLDRLQSLLAQGVEINARDSLGRTALMVAAMGRQKNLVIALMDAGADAALRDQAGLSAADHATRAGHADWLPLMQPKR